MPTFNETRDGQEKDIYPDTVNYKHHFSIFSRLDEKINNLAEIFWFLSNSVEGKVFRNRIQYYNTTNENQNLKINQIVKKTWGGG